MDNIGKIISNGNKYYYVKDHLGSVRAVVNENGVVVSAQDYDAWGYLLEGRKYQTDTSRYKFTGKEWDVESEYDYFGARYYDARIGRWGAVDPLSNREPAKTPYHYTSDNPLNKIDPNGLDDYYYKGGELIDQQPGEYAWMYRLGVRSEWFDRYFVQNESGNVSYNEEKYFQALSSETVNLTKWKHVWADWESTGFSDRVSSSVDAYEAKKGDYLTIVDFAFFESKEKGALDQKYNLINPNDPEAAKEYLYIYDNIAFNWRQAGNIVWGASMRKFGFTTPTMWAGAQFYSLILSDSHSLDQPDEVRSFLIGYHKSSWRLYGE